MSAVSKTSLTATGPRQWPAARAVVAGACGRVRPPRQMRPGADRRFPRVDAGQTSPTSRSLVSVPSTMAVSASHAGGCGRHAADQRCMSVA